MIYKGNEIICNNHSERARIYKNIYFRQSVRRCNKSTIFALWEVFLTPNIRILINDRIMRRFFALFALLALLLSACEVDTPTPNEPKMPEISVLGGVITMPAAGGEAEINYQIINPTDGAMLEAATTDEWITNLTVEDTITFTVERNHAEQRIGIVTLHYPNAEDVSVAIQQNEALAAGDVRISITSDRKTIFEADGGKGTVSYMLECEDEGAVPEVTTDVEWITIGKVDATSVSYTVARSLVEEKRTGHITLAYSGKSAEATIEQKAAELIPELSAEKTTVRRGDKVCFVVSYGEKDVTADATIYDYYTNAEIDNPYTTTEAGERVFYAMYNNRRSKVLTINIIPEYAPEFPVDSEPENYNFNQRMLIVDHTGVGCGYCPNMKSTLKALEENDDCNYKFNIVYAYSFNSSEVCYSPMSYTLWQYYKEVCKTSYMPLTGYPSATFNFCRDFAASPAYVQTKINEYWNDNPSASVALAAAINDGKVVISTEVKSRRAQNIRLSLWILEDDIYARQSGATADWMHTHHSVLRDCPTGVSKNNISGIDFGYVAENGTIQRVYEYPVSDSWVSDNLKVIAIISSVNYDFGNRYEVVNTAMCEVGSTKSYEYKTR